MKLNAALLSFSLVVASAACVTVNVNFPESAVQRAADDYVKDLYQAKSKGRQKDTLKDLPPTPAASPAAKAQPPIAFFAAAWADEPETIAETLFKADTEKAVEIREKLRSMLDDVIAQKQAGILGEKNDGHLELRDASKLKPILKSKVEKLVRDENDLRDDLYSEIRKSNHMARNHLTSIQKSFARSFQKVSPAGTWIQDETGAWTQKH